MSHPRMLRSIGVALTAGLLVATAACNRGESAGQSAGGGGGGQGVTMTLAVSTLNNPFFIQLRDGAQDAATKAGVQLNVVDAQNDAATQQNQLANAATQGVAAVIINPVDSEAAAAAVDPVERANIPIVAVDRAVEGKEVTSMVASDNVAGGKQAAQAMADAVGKKGQLVVLQGVPGTSASRDRGAGFDQGLTAFPDVTVVARQPANFDRTQGLNVATNLMESNPGVTGIFAENDEMALGAVQALGNRAGKEVFVVGFDGTDDALKAVQNGTMYATIAQQPAELGRAGVEEALAAVNGKNVDKVRAIEVKTVTKDNVGDFLK